MYKVLPVLVCLLFLYLQNCSNNSTNPSSSSHIDTLYINNSSGKVGYFFKLDYSIVDTNPKYIRPTIYAPQIPEEIPEVVINGEKLWPVFDATNKTTIFFQTNKMYLGILHREGGSVIYSIRTRNDTLTDTFVVPPPIDSLYVNNIYAPCSTEARIGQANTAVLQWPAVGNVDYYYIYIVYSERTMDCMGDSLTSRVVHENQCVLPVVSCVNDFLVWISPLPSPPLRSGRVPDAESKTMYVMYSDPLLQTNIYNVLVRR